MAKRMRLRAGDVDTVVELRDTPTVDALWMQLPLEARAARWGDEFYFRIPSMMADVEADAREEMAVGEVGYWVSGQAVAVFFGRTPASEGDEPRAVEPVNVIGRVIGDARGFARLDDGVTFHLERVE